MIDPSLTPQIPSFIYVSDLLRSHGFRSPRVLAYDEKHLALVEDFGELTFSQCLQSSPSLIIDYYRLGIDVLVQLRKTFTTPIRGIASFNEEIYKKELTLFAEWYYPSVTKRELDPKAFSELCNLITQLIQDHVQDQTFVLRDFHIDNMMILENTLSIKHCGLLDFQDALNGSVAYDLASLLQDSRSPITDEMIHQMLQEYYQKYQLRKGNIESEMCAYHAVGIQRNIKNLGVFTRMFFLKSKDRYLHYIPRLWDHIHSSLKQHHLKEIKRWFDDYLPSSLRQKPFHLE